MKPWPILAWFRNNGCVVFPLACLLFAPGLARAQSPAISLAVRQYYLDNLIKVPDYVPGKNSFLIQDLHRGEKRSVLELKASGSVRHIWSTWSIPGDDSDIPAPGRILVRVFVDGRSQPDISGALDDLCRAAGKTGDRFVPFPAFNYKGAFNLYLPIFFERGIRIEIEATGEVSEFYTQIDYRTGGQHSSARLISEKTTSALTLKYVGGPVSWRAAESEKRHTVQQNTVINYGEANSGEITLRGPGVLSELSLEGDNLADLELAIYWDDDTKASVQAPLKYLFAEFTNAAMESTATRSRLFFPMPFRKQTRLSIHSLTGQSGTVRIAYSFEPGLAAKHPLYFHAEYADNPKTTGYSQYSVLQARGSGLFVGMNLFDSGHNHGGGDAALLDAGTAHPHVLHGICGEDYFGFAWHNTGAMTPLTGAPAHQRRYRLHLENPYPFHDSIQFLFGVFAGQYPKSVAFWYQLPSAPSKTDWVTTHTPWNILGPLSLDTPLSDTVSGKTYPTVIPLNNPTPVEERWQKSEIRSGFFDATYQFRHYVMIEKGTGFVVGSGKTKLITYIYSPSNRKLEAILGHDDRVIVTTNDGELELPAQYGFGPSRIQFRLRRGWNKMDVLVFNDENVDWRWCGISLAFDNKHSAGLTFATEPSVKR